MLFTFLVTMGTHLILLLYNFLFMRILFINGSLSIISYRLYIIKKALGTKSFRIIVIFVQFIDSLSLVCMDIIMKLVLISLCVKNMSNAMLSPGFESKNYLEILVIYGHL